MKPHISSSHDYAYKCCFRTYNGLLENFRASLQNLDTLITWSYSGPGFPKASSGPDLEDSLLNMRTPSTHRKPQNEELWRWAGGWAFFTPSPGDSYAHRSLSSISILFLENRAIATAFTGILLQAQVKSPQVSFSEEPPLSSQLIRLHDLKNDYLSPALKHIGTHLSCLNSLLLQCFQNVSPVSRF